MSNTTAQEMKLRSRKTITSPMTDNVYQIKSLSQIDFSRAQLTPILPVNGDGTPRVIDFSEAAKRTIDSMQYVLERAVVAPRIFFGEESATPDDQAHADWIAPDQGWLYSEVLKHSGLDEKSQKDLEELLKNAHGSEISVKPEDASDLSPATS